MGDVQKSGFWTLRAPRIAWVALVLLIVLVTAEIVSVSMLGTATNNTFSKVRPSVATPVSSPKSVTASNASSTPDTKIDNKDIIKIMEDQRQAWNKGDLDGFMAGYWKSDALTFFSGKDRTKGWQATMDRYRKKYQGEGKEMGQLTFSELEIEPLGIDSAFVRGRWQLTTSKAKPGGLFTLFIKKLPEGWRIVHDHTSGE